MPAGMAAGLIIRVTQYGGNEKDDGNDIFPGADV